MPLLPNQQTESHCHECTIYSCNPPDAATATAAKFMLVTLLFMLPLVVVMALLIKELGASISFAQDERVGVRMIRQVEELVQLTQQSRALRHMALSGNKQVAESATKLQADITKKIAAIDQHQHDAVIPGTSAAWSDIKQAWSGLTNNLPGMKAKDSYTAHTAIIAKMIQYNALLADRSNLTLDPQVDTYYLINTFVKSLPEIAEQLSEIAGRGAAYIDTGLLEPKEDVLLNSTATLAQLNLDRITPQLEAIFRENPALKPQLAAQMSAMPSTLSFLERTKNEVINTSNQATGSQFVEAGFKAIDGLYAFAHTSSVLLDAALLKRIAKLELRRNLIIAGVLLVLLLAAYLLTGFYRSLAKDVSELEEAVMRAASGDLATRISSNGKDEIGQLINAFGQMNAGLALLVSEVRNGTDTISVASREIATGNADLSSRTEKQAGSLQGTVLSMEQLATTVKQTTENAQQANQLALAASDVAIRGGAAVAQVVGTMGAISTSAKKINDIISVIDGIAFQTNILALNAAVEAARAGEQGRGFAVVAAEVRNLAQRSATAAKEIKTLIVDSVEKVGAGSKQVKEAGETMGQIVSSVHLLTDIISKITVASLEQRNGIEQVNHAVGQIDQITQQNAAMGEQVAAAAESMQGQVQSLSKAVSVFRLAKDQPAPEMLETMTPVLQCNVRSIKARQKSLAKVSEPIEWRTARTKKQYAAVANGQREEWEEWERI